MTESSSSTLADLKQDAVLWYKIQVLLYDLCHISTDRASEARTLRTTDELYISGPYFTALEAERIKAATVELIDVPADAAIEDPTSSVGAGTEWTEANSPGIYKVADPRNTQLTRSSCTIEQAIKVRLSGFLDKRKASGDSRPCGPHDLGPIYKAVFGISQADLQDERFLSRLRRSGLSDSKAEKSKDEVTKGQGRKKGK